MMNFGTVLYQTKERVATITLNRPERCNAISETMPEDIAAAFNHAGDDSSVHVVVLTGAGRGFCGGYDLKAYAEKPGANRGIQEMPWDPMIDFDFMSRCTRNFMAIWRCHKPVVARVHGDAVAGGSDIALCCDMIVMNEKARIGYPPARVWGCPTTAMWVYRLGAERAKKMLFTGDLVTGAEAAEMGLVLEAVPLEKLDDAVKRLVDRIKGVPKNQLMMMKLMINQAYENMGLHSTQTLATLFDGIARHSPEGIWFKRRAEEAGFKQAVADRDSGDPIPGSKDQRSEWREHRMKVNPDFVAPCGLYCGVCAIRMADRDNNEKFKERLVAVYQGKIPGKGALPHCGNLTTADIKCDGCLSENRFLHCRQCEIRDCAIKKGYTGCHECNQFPCRHIENFPMTIGKKVILRAIPHWREVGTEKWIQDEEARYVCPECGNKVFRGAAGCNKCKSALNLD